MKNLLYIVLLLLGVMFTSCYDEDIESINSRLNAIENTQIATISQQITSIDNSILLLNNADKELKDYITALETQAENLQTQLTTTNLKIDSVKNELTETISTEKAAVLAELETLKVTVNGELEALKVFINELKAKDTALEGHIAELKTYVDTELKATEDWITATFATLEQYNTVVTTIATVEGQIEGINESLTALENRITEKIAKDIEAASATLSADLQKAVEGVTTAYTSAIATAKADITTAYTAALEESISVLETSMKEWVNEQLSTYSTIVETETKITALQSEVDGKLAAQKTYLEALVNALSSSVTTDITAIRKQIEEVNETIDKNAEEIEKLRGELVDQKEELTEAYTTVIAAAIAENEGKMSNKLADEVAAINERINKSDIAAIETLIANCKQRMKTLEDDVAQLKVDVLKLQVDVEELQEIAEKLLAQIQSITYIPTYNDGKATVDYHTKRGSLNFQISPKSAINDLEKVWQTALSVKAVATHTRAINFINLPIVSFVADATNGTITIEVDGTNFADAFYNLDDYAACTLCFDDGKNEKNSPYIQMISSYILFEDDLVESKCLAKYDNNQDGKLSFPEAAAVTSLVAFGSSSMIKADPIKCFNELRYFTGLSEIEAGTFQRCDSLRSFVIPDSVISIGESAFSGCNRLSGITIPDSVISIGKGAFSGCNNLIDVHIGNGVLEIGDSAFSSCKSLSSIAIPDNVTLIDEYAFAFCPLETIYVGCGVTTIGSAAFQYSYTDGESPLKSVYIKAATPSTCPSYTFDKYSYNNSTNQRWYTKPKNLTIYVPRASVSAYKSEWSYYRDQIVGCDFE